MFVAFFNLSGASSSPLYATASRYTRPSRARLSPGIATLVTMPLVGSHRAARPEGPALPRSPVCAFSTWTMSNFP